MNPKPIGRVRNKQHLAAVHSLPCLATSVDPSHKCEGKIDAAHLGNRAQNRKANDDTSVSLCHKAHMQLHSLSGPFKHFTKEQRRAWEQWAIAETRKKLGRN